MTTDKDSSNTTAHTLGHCLVTGAAGFFGSNMVKLLLAKGIKTRALIRNSPLDLSHPNLEIINCDVTDAKGLIEACEGIDTVFHTASVMAFLGGSAVTPSYQEWAYNINVTGTKNVIAACKQNNVKRLVYTSSTDVCFDRDNPGQLNEASPYTPKPSCVYSATKQEAEKAVLANNNTANSKGEMIYTCAIRPDGIYGAEDNYMIDTFAEQLINGRLKAKIGGDNIIKDNSHVLNLVEAHYLAATHLTSDGPVNGNAYFISDDDPMNPFEFFRPLIEGMGYRVPSLSIPAGLIRPILLAWQYLHFKFGLPEPALSPHELDKISVTHYGSNEAAERDFGFKPVITVNDAMKGCLAYCQKKFQ